jgi:hypothetical protein
MGIRPCGEGVVKRNERPGAGGGASHAFRVINVDVNIDVDIECEFGNPN